ncbi:hypothetical protein A1Q1_00052 [Trichosporon asahii var. asahii CBS 2479]|uniref:Uncharacterized protein n=1 Tax=Trichosporon asahii var. asahii (strain ATCC 90039 / CBS 2479 / JCM 2466 / KCTC 7840 / NBRC 103889/ NCYC 2677 / UAMH 7654) TaxID=1186058 RepID=J8TZ21_TRIAS|nr:hypothetical protein A1Q1_00052 [Trichosporon asahii var. asahii CBS 2479]EJT53045.1 hypothetical protein A1Q1_00052 [Trichosporon asahii var. asahii CBS 2479]
MHATQRSASDGFSAGSAFAGSSQKRRQVTCQCGQRVCAAFYEAKTRAKIFLVGRCSARRWAGWTGDAADGRRAIAGTGGGPHQVQDPGPQGARDGSPGITGFRVMLPPLRASQRYARGSAEDNVNGDEMSGSNLILVSSLDKGEQGCRALFNRSSKGPGGPGSGATDIAQGLPHHGVGGDGSTHLATCQGASAADMQGSKHQDTREIKLRTAIMRSGMLPSYSG